MRSMEKFCVRDLVFVVELGKDIDRGETITTYRMAGKQPNCIARRILAGESQRLDKVLPCGHSIPLHASCPEEA